MISALGVFDRFHNNSIVTSPVRAGRTIDSRIRPYQQRSEEEEEQTTGHFVLKCVRKFVKVAPQVEQQPLVSTVRFHFPPVIIVSQPPDIATDPTSRRSRDLISPQGYGIFSGTLGHGRY